MSDTTMVVKNGDTVTLHYSGFDDDGNNVDSTLNRAEPATVTLGKGVLIAGLEEAILGMAEGQSKTVLIPADKAFVADGHPLNGLDLIYELKVLAINPV